MVPVSSLKGLISIYRVLVGHPAPAPRELSIFAGTPMARNAILGQAGPRAYFTFSFITETVK
jgi:hypothetical protein